MKPGNGQINVYEQLKGTTPGHLQRRQLSLLPILFPSPAVSSSGEQDLTHQISKDAEICGVVPVIAARSAQDPDRGVRLPAEDGRNGA